MPEKKCSSYLSSMKTITNQKQNKTNKKIIEEKKIAHHNAEIC